MAHVNTYVDVDRIGDNELRDNVFMEGDLEQGILVTEGTESASIVLDAFPSGGYSMSDAYELRDLILKFNKEHGITPTVL